MTNREAEKKLTPIQKLAQRFACKVTRIGGKDGCHRWNGPLDKKGYGRFSYKARSLRAHRVAYMLYKGRIPDGLVLDHKCRNRWCVNPNHLRPMTNRENTLLGVSEAAQRARRTVCPAGHPLTGANVYQRPSRGGRTRECKECKKRRSAEWRKKAKEEGDASFPFGALAPAEKAA